MALETITEPAFLLTELRYTLGQLHVQALDLDETARNEARCEGRSIEDILQEMVQYETEYQARYQGLLRGPSPDPQPEAQGVQLPVSEAEQVGGTEHDFEELRSRTIDMLGGAAEPWPTGLVEMVKEQVGRDRQATTQIAECRKSWLSQEQRADLQEPLTESNEPHVLADESASDSNAQA